MDAKRIKRNRKFVGNPLQKKLLFLIFAAAIIPTAISVLSFSYLIFYLLAWQAGISEAIAHNLIPLLKKIGLFVLIFLPIFSFFIWIIALELSHRIAGPLSRLERELDDRISRRKQGHIRLRIKDEFKSIAEKINRLMDMKG